MEQRLDMIKEWLQDFEDNILDIQSYFSYFFTQAKNKSFCVFLQDDLCFLILQKGNERLINYEKPYECTSSGGALAHREQLCIQCIYVCIA